ncbi:MAG TPA: molecular chaperone SurA, partial [Variovorax sp.]
MNHLRFLLFATCLAGLATAADAQGITDIMRAGPRLQPAPAVQPPRPPAGPAVQQSAEYIVALVNSEPITNTEVQSRMMRVLKENPDAQRMPREALVHLVLERLINERAQL